MEVNYQSYSLGPLGSLTKLGFIIPQDLILTVKVPILQRHSRGSSRVGAVENAGGGEP